MQISDLSNAGATPTLAAMMQFASARQRILAHNVANIDTPDFRPVDLSVAQFQEQLAQAVRKRREAGAEPAPSSGVVPNGTDSAPLVVDSSKELRQNEDGSLEFTPTEASANVLYHDRNNRDPERMMQALAENQLAFRVATDLLRRQTDIMRMAITQRP